MVLSSMVMVLLAIRRLTKFEGFDDETDTKVLKEEIEENAEVLSTNSIFHNLVETSRERDNKKQNYKSNSKEPVSRRE